MTLHDRMKKNEFGYAIGNSSILPCKTWALANNWETLLSRNPILRNAKQVLNAVMFWHKTQTKKVVRYLNEQNICVSYMGVGEQSKKWENDVLHGESGTFPFLNGVCTHSSMNNIDEEPKFISLNFDKL